MPPAARITDFHACPMVNPGPTPHVGGPVAKGSPNVLTGKLPQARVGDMAVCAGPMDVIVRGSTGVFVNKMPAARIGDMTAHGGIIVAGLPTVIIGETKGGGGGGAGVPTAAMIVAYAEVLRQLKVLIDAWQTGAPFCEICFKEAADKVPAQAPKKAPSSQPQPMPKTARASGATVPKVASPPMMPSAGTAPSAAPNPPKAGASSLAASAASAAGPFDYLNNQEQVNKLNQKLQSAADKTLDQIGNVFDQAVDSAFEGIGGWFGNLGGAAKIGTETADVFSAAEIVLQIQRSNSKTYQTLDYVANVEINQMGLDEAVNFAHDLLVDTNYIHKSGSVLTKDEVKAVLLFIQNS